MGGLGLRAVHSHRVSIHAMTKELRQQTKTGLAWAIAGLWARVNHVPRSTAFRWAGEPEVRATAGTCLGRAWNCALGRMANRANSASYQVAALARVAKSDSVKLWAPRSILSGAHAMSRVAVLNRRLAAIKDGLQEPTENAGPLSPETPCSLVYARSNTAKKAPFSLIFPPWNDAFGGSGCTP
jgi:hypothetical protein